MYGQNVRLSYRELTERDSLDGNWSGGVRVARIICWVYAVTKNAVWRNWIACNWGCSCVATIIATKVLHSKWLLHVRFTRVVTKCARPIGFVVDHWLISCSKNSNISCVMFFCASTAILHDMPSLTYMQSMTYLGMRYIHIRVVQPKYNVSSGFLLSVWKTCFDDNPRIVSRASAFMWVNPLIRVFSDVVFQLCD